MFLNDKNKTSWGGDETMSEEIYVWTIMAEIKINPDWYQRWGNTLSSNISNSEK